jgi:hypothetical protein
LLEGVAVGRCAVGRVAPGLCVWHTKVSISTWGSVRQVQVARAVAELLSSGASNSILELAASPEAPAADLGALIAEVVQDHMACLMVSPHG